jgi:predicted outer membrane lipoprotein
MGPNSILGLQLLATAFAWLNKKRLGPCPHIDVDQDIPPPQGSFTTAPLWVWLELIEHQRGDSS